MRRNLKAPYCFILVNVLMLSAVLCTLMATCSKSANTTEQVQYDTVGLRNGDLLFRNGIGYESRVVTGLSDGKFSHVGIAYHNGRQWNVIHAVPGENEKDEPEYLKCEPISEFYYYSRAKLGGTARVSCTDSIANVVAERAFHIVNRKVLFDNNYDINNYRNNYYYKHNNYNSC